MFGVELPIGVCSLKGRAGACKKNELLIPSGAAGALPSQPHHVLAKVFACIYFFPPKPWLWLRCRGVCWSFIRQAGSPKKGMGRANLSFYRHSSGKATDRAAITSLRLFTQCPERARAPSSVVLPSQEPGQTANRAGLARESMPGRH